ncbi:MAG: hypothetical protein AB7O62_19165 [Pirellulales bacterium]
MSCVAKINGLSLLLALLAGSAAVPVSAQDQPGKDVAVAANAPRDIEPSDKGPFRRLAPGVERTIDPAQRKEESLSRHDLLDVVAADPNFGERPWSDNLAKDIRYEHEVWALEFTFKPVRYIQVDVPNGSGRFDRKTLWYMVYHVRNTSDEPVRFIPRFMLHSWDNGKYYPDRIIPLANKPIRLREDPRRRLLNAVEISDVSIKPSKKPGDNEVWGVVTWEDIDPTTDRFSIYIQGLSNAYIWKDGEKLKDGSQKYYRKTLQLNFYRPGDELHEHEREIRFGIPDEVDYRWDYK